MRLDDGRFGKFSVRLDFGTSLHSSQTCPRRSGLANNHELTQSCLQSAFIWRMSDPMSKYRKSRAFSGHALTPDALTNSSSAEPRQRGGELFHPGQSVLSPFAVFLDDFFRRAGHEIGIAKFAFDFVRLAF